MATQAPAPTPTPADDEPRTAVERMAKKTNKLIREKMEMEQERNGLKAKLEELTKELEPLKSSNAELEGLKAELRTLKHRSISDNLLREAGLDTPKKLEAFYKLSEMKFEGDPDAEKIGEFIKAQADTLDLLRGQPAPEQPLIKPAVGRGKGSDQPARQDESKFEVTDAQMRDPAWCFANQDKIRAAASRVINLPNAQVGEGFSIVR